MCPKTLRPISTSNSGYRPPMVSNQIRPPGFPPIQNPHANSQNNFNRGNNFNQNRGNNFNQGQIYRPPVNQPVAHQGPAPQTHASTSGSGTLPGNTVTYPKEDLKDSIIPCEFSGIITPARALADLGASINLMPYSVWKDLSLSELTPTCMTLELADRSITTPIGIAKDVRVLVGKFQFPADFVVVEFEPDPRVPLILGRCFLKTSRALIDVYEGEITLRVGKEAITFNLDQTSRYTANFNHMTANRIDVIDMASEEYSRESDFLLFEEANAFLALEDDYNFPEVDSEYYDPDGDILILEAFLETKIQTPIPNQEIVYQNPRRISNFVKPKLFGGEDRSVSKVLKFSQKEPLLRKLSTLQRMDVEKPLDAGIDLPTIFRSHGHSIVHTDHSALKYLFAKKDAKARLLRWVLLLQEFDFKVLDTKGAENLAADHLSRLENPYETFRLKRLRNIPLEDVKYVYHGDVCNGKEALDMLEGLPTRPPWDSMCNLTAKRSLIPASFGLPFTRMPTSLSKTVTRANDKEKLRNGMRCLKTPSKFVKSLTFGALTLWARSRLHEGTNIFSWPLTTCQNGLKRKRSPPMMPESTNLQGHADIGGHSPSLHRVSSTNKWQAKVSNRGLNSILKGHRIARIVKGTVISQKDEKPSKKQQNQSWDGKNEYAVLDKKVRYAVSNGSGYAVSGLEFGRYGVLTEVNTAYRGFLGVGTTFDIFQNILLLYLEYGVSTSSGYGVLNLVPSWSLVKCRHRYAVSSLMDTACRMYVVPTGRVIVPTGRYVVPAGKVIIIVSPGSDNDSDDASIHSEATIPQQQRNIQPQYITTVSNNNAKFPYLKKVDLKRTGRDCDGRVIILPPTTADEHIVVQRESKARTTLLQSIPDDHVADFHYMDDARDIWNAVKARFGGNAESKKMRKSMLKQEFLEFRIGDAGEFALMGVTSEVHNCPFGCDNKYNELQKQYNELNEQNSEYFIQVQAYKNSLKTLEKPKRVLQKIQLTLVDKISMLSIELENTTNLLKHSERINAIVETAKKDLQTKLDNHLVQTEKWRTSSKNLFRLVDSSMSVRTKVGLGFNNYIGENELGWDDSAFSIFTTNSEEVKGRPNFNRFAKTDSMKAVPPHLSGDYTPLSDHTDLDESQMSYGTKSLTSGDSNSVSNNFVSCDNNDKSSEVNSNDFAFSDSSVKSLEPKSNDSTSCASTSSISTSESEAEIESNVGTPI
ncbi:xylulose kinase-1 [Tanacetum coccineum]